MGMCGGDENEVKETQAERTNARIGVERLQRYRDIYVPIENDFIKKNSSPTELRETAASEANVGTQMKLDQARDQVEAVNTARGARPGSGAFNADATAAEAATAKGLAVVSARENADDVHVSRLQSILDMGRGKEVDALKGMTHQARLAGADAIGDAATRAARKEGYGEAIGTVGGMAGAHYANRPDPTADVKGLKVAQADWERQTGG